MVQIRTKAQTVLNKGNECQGFSEENLGNKCTGDCKGEKQY